MASLLSFAPAPFMYGYPGHQSSSSSIDETIIADSTPTPDMSLGLGRVCLQFARPGALRVA